MKSLFCVDFTSSLVDKFFEIDNDGKLISKETVLNSVHQAIYEGFNIYGERIVDSFFKLTLDDEKYYILVFSRVFLKNGTIRNYADIIEFVPKWYEGKFPLDCMDMIYIQRET